MKNLFLILGLLLCLNACQTKDQIRENKSKAEADFDLKAIKDSIAQANQLYEERFTRDDAQMYAKRYCRDAVIFPAENPSIAGRDSIRAYYYDKGRNKELKIVITEKNIYGSPELVVEEGIYDFPDGKGGSFDKGKFIALWKKEEGSWKLFREIWNTDLPPVKK